jgi:uncharacterized membrane protein
MRAINFVLIALVLAFTASDTRAQEQKTSDIKGLFLVADYPAVTVQAGVTSNVYVRLHNYGLPPERLSLSVDGVPEGWKVALLGGGQPVAAAMPATDKDLQLQLRLTVPDTAQSGTHTLTVNARGANQSISLPLAVTLAKDLPAQLSLDPKLPALRGSPTSNFDFELTLRNDSGRNLVVSLAAQAPENFQATFTEAFGTQELSSIPVEAGQSKEVKASLRPPRRAEAGQYPVRVVATAEDAQATAEVIMDIAGTPQLRIGGRDGAASTRAEAGNQTSVPIVVQNDGSAAALEIELSGSAPTGWTLDFEPKQVARIAAGEREEVQLRLTPSAKALAGDYMTSLRANARGESASVDFRVAVATSTYWGIAGVGIIGAALLIMVGAIARYGRR